MRELLRKIGSEAMIALLTFGAIPWTVWTTKTLFQLQEDIAVIKAISTQQSTYNAIPQDFVLPQQERKKSISRLTPAEFVSFQSIAE